MHLCGQCMVGCRHGAKNTLVKNYLYFAEKRGARVMPERTVVDIRPIGSPDGSEGYEVESVRSGAWLRKERRVQRARGVVVSAGPLGTNKLLQRCRLNGSLPRISARLGELVRTNSESILTVTVPEDYPEDLIKRVAITSSIYPDPNTHIETVTYGDGGDSMRAPLHAAHRRRHAGHAPAEAARPDREAPRAPRAVLFPKHWSRRTIIILVMQTLDNAIALRPRTGPSATFWLQDRTGPGAPNPTFIPVANKAAQWFANESAASPRARDGGDVQHPEDRPHPRRRRDRADPEAGRHRLRAAGVRLREPLGLRRLGDPGQRRRQPDADDHRAGRPR